MIEHTPLVIAIAVMSAFLVGLSKGGLPSVGAIAVPFLALVISPVTAAALLLPIFVASDMVGLYLYRRQFSARNLAILIPAALVGVGIGWAFSAHVSPLFVGFLVGLTGLAFCLNAWFGARFRGSAPKGADVPSGLFWGALTGFTSFVSHSGAPPYQMYVLPQRLEKMVFAGTSTILFAIVNAAKILPYWALSQFDHFDTSLLYILAPAAILGTIVGKRLTVMIPEVLFYRLIQATLFLLSIKLIADYLLVL